ncbi:MAG: HAMP domain-containing sensor histidine kinase [Steroidobacter sp.]
MKRFDVVSGPNTMNAWWHSPLSRLIWFSPLLVVIILGLILVPTYREAVNDIKTGVRAVINEEALGLNEIYRQQGIEGLIPAVDQRNRALDTAAIYLLIDAQGKRLAGDDIEWPDKLLPVSDSDSGFVIAPGDSKETLVAKEFTYSDGSRLLVGQRSPLNNFRSNLRIRLSMATFLAFLGSLALGAWTLGRYRRRLERIEHSARHILSGNLSQRLQLDGRRDELDQLANEFNQAFAEIEKLMDATRHVSSAIAHDMRRPISALRYRLEELSRRSDLPDELHEHVDALLQQTDESLNTFSALLRLARLESGSYGPKREPVDIHALITEVADTYEPVATAHHMQLISQCDAAQVMGDWNLLFLSLQNLLDNAIHYGREKIEIKSQCSDREVIITVRDHGPGVDETVLPKLFDRFFRGDEARTAGGSGIGLALVRAVADTHGGQVSAFNANPGLCVKIQLPLRQNTN